MLLFWSPVPKGKGARKNEILNLKYFVFILFCTVLSLIFVPELSHLNNVFLCSPKMVENKLYIYFFISNTYVHIFLSLFLFFGVGCY